MRSSFLMCLLPFSLRYNRQPARTGDEPRPEDQVNLSSKQPPADARRAFKELVRDKGYPCESHQITTEDGYKLTCFRIQSKEQEAIESGKPVVFLQHGLLDSADTWILNVEAKAPAYILANKGYDVWLGNSRGNKYSREHVQYNPDKSPEYWDFTWQHMAEKDHPAVFEYIWKLTQKKIHYIGISQGALTMLAALSSKYPFTQHLGAFVALAPPFYLKSVNSNFVRALAATSFAEWFLKWKMHEFLSINFAMDTTFPLFCSAFPFLFSSLISSVADIKPDLIEVDLYNVIAKHVPSGTSILNMLHFQQMVNTNTHLLLKYDYGTKKNLQVYGTRVPPSYDLANINRMVHVFAGTYDRLATVDDIKVLVDTLGPHAEYYEYPIGHVSFVWGKDMSYFDKVLEVLDRYN